MTVFLNSNFPWEIFNRGECILRLLLKNKLHVCEKKIWINENQILEELHGNLYILKIQRTKGSQNKISNILHDINTFKNQLLEERPLIWIF